MKRGRWPKAWQGDSQKPENQTIDTIKEKSNQLEGDVGETEKELAGPGRRGSLVPAVRENLLQMQ